MRISKIAAAAAIAVMSTLAAHAPLPSKLIAAKTVYLQNSGSDSATFDGIYDKLTKWGRWQVVADRENADLVLALSDSDAVGAFSSASSGPGYANSTVVPYVRRQRFLLLFDSQSGDQLLNVSCEHRWTGALTADALVSKVKKRLDGK